jgi:DNA polymerase III gamma/tau subunit
MSNQASLYLKHRPTSLGEIIGNEAVISAVANMLKDKKKCPHAFLLTGGTGCGKTTLGRIIAKELGVSDSDFREVDSADFRGIDTVREIRKNSQYKPLEGSCRVWLIDECHKMTGDAQSAFLKALEDTPPHVYFILCTTDPQKLLPTIRGRCTTFSMEPLSDRLMMGLLRQVTKAENENLSKQIYEQIIQDSQGHPRNALQVLDQVLRVPVEKRMETAQRTAEEQSQVIELCRALVKNESWSKIKVILNGLKGQDPESIRRMVLGYCQAILLKAENQRAGLIMEEFIEPFYNTGFPGLVFACFSINQG